MLKIIFKALSFAKEGTSTTDVNVTPTYSISVITVISELISHNSMYPNSLIFFIYIYTYSKLGDPKDTFSLDTTPRCRGGCYSFHRNASLYP